MCPPGLPQAHYVAKADLAASILLPAPSKPSVCISVPPCPSQSSFRLNKAPSPTQVQSQPANVMAINELQA